MTGFDSAHPPASRPRRLRRGQRLRDAVADVAVRPQDLIYPIFVTDNEEARPIASMPDVDQMTVNGAVEAIRQLAVGGLGQFILFGVTPAAKKDPVGSYAASPLAPVNRVLAQVRQAGLDVLMWADLCFCEYTDHGHCGVVDQSDTAWVVDNDPTVQRLAATAVAQAKAGADVVAPSGMMDGQVRAIRAALDEAGFQGVVICAYSVKFASDLYGPFRDAGEGGVKFGDRRGYQMDYRRRHEWLVEVEADVEQGADIVMVKPAIAYLDIIHQVRQACSIPVAAYHVSGEYAMLHAAARLGWLELKPTVLEHTHAIKRAGADLILTYFAPQLLEWL